MKMHVTPLGEGIRSISAVIRTVPIPPKASTDEPPPPAPVLPFITLSRQPYAGAWTLAQQLVDALNLSDPGERPWTCWDRELVEKVAADHHLSRELVESIEDEHYSWITDFLSSLSFADSSPITDEAKVYEGVATTIRTLAKAGRVVIVGRGGVFLTRRMVGGIHIRLIASAENRVAFLAQKLNMSHELAAARLRQLERNRMGFYKRYWPGESLNLDVFAATLNTGVLDTPTMIQIIQALVRQRVMAGR